MIRQKLYYSSLYYPFGMLFAETSTAEQGKQPYKYNGKELDQAHGLNWYDYEARHKDDWRFITVDPMAEKYYSISPYVYCANNPLKYIDPTGMEYGDYYDMYTGEHIFNDGIDDGMVYIRDTKTHFTPGGMFGGSIAVTTTVDIPLEVKKHEIPDKTVEFTALLKKTNEFFTKKNESMAFAPLSTKLYIFRGYVTNESLFDIKKQKNGPFNEDIDKNWGDGHAFFNGKLFRSDDFGNFNFGIAAKAFGIPEWLGQFGAGAIQVKDHFAKRSPVGGALSYWDDYKDNSMIKQGYKYYNKNFKK